MRSILFFLIFFAFITFSQQETLLVVDDFIEGPLQIDINVQTAIEPSAPVSNSSFYVSPQGSSSKSILGGERDFEFTVSSSLQGRVFSTSVKPNNNEGEWYTSTPSGGSGYVTMQYDGLDGGSMSINTTGLIGVNGNTDGFDITFGGRANGFTMNVQTDVNTDLQFNVYSPDGSLCSIVVTIPAWDEQDFHAIFNSFGGNCDFTKVGAIELVLDSVENAEITITSFDVYGSSLLGEITLDNFFEGAVDMSFLLNQTIKYPNTYVNSTIFLSPSGINSSNILGGERDLEFQVTAGNKGTAFGISINTDAPQNILVTTPSNGELNFVLQYDGPDNSMNLNVAGLVGVNGNTEGLDITQGGKNSGFNLQIATDKTVYVSLYVYSPNGSSCNSYTMIISQPTIQNFLIPFHFLSGNCNLEQVGAIEMEVELYTYQEVEIYSLTTHV